MAVSKSDLFAYVEEFKRVNGRPCPKSQIVSTYGEDALAVLKELTTDGSINCRRGRNGGYFPTDTTVATPAEVAEEPVAEEPVAEVENDVADQFAALQAKLAALEESESEQETANL